MTRRHDCSTNNSIPTKQNTDYFKTRLHAYMPYAYGLFMAGFFFIPNAVDQYKLFSVAVFVPLLFIAKDLLTVVRRQTLWLLICTYLVWMLTTSFWSDTFSPVRFFETSRLVLYILAFILLTVYLKTTKPELFKKILVTICFSAGIAALISIPLWYTQHAFPDSRLVGIGTLENTNTSSYLYGFHALLSVFLGLNIKTRLLRRMLYINSAILVCFVLLTHSNAGILATTGAITLLLLLKNFKNSLEKLLGVSILAFFVLFLLFSLGLTNKPMDNGLSARILIWKAVLTRIDDAPIIGNGYQKPLRNPSDSNLEPPYYTHNTLLGTLRDGGLIGGLLYIFILSYAVYLGIRIYRQTGDPFYLAVILFGLLCMLSDTDEVITRPRELWIIFWLPLALVIAQDIKNKVSSHSFALQHGNSSGNTRKQRACEIVLSRQAQIRTSKYIKDKKVTR